MAREHDIARTDYDLGALADELLARLGVGVSVQAGRGRLRVLDVHGNGVDVDPGVVAQVIAAHVPPPVVVPPIERLAVDLEGAVTLVEVRSALLRWARAARGPVP